MTLFVLVYTVPLVLGAMLLLPDFQTTILCFYAAFLLAWEFIIREVVENNLSYRYKAEAALVVLFVPLLLLIWFVATLITLPLRIKR